jgi:hypothetical protein
LIKVMQIFSMFSSRSFIVFGDTFWYIIHFVLFFF